MQPTVSIQENLNLMLCKRAGAPGEGLRGRE
jgi:hypothetical protein